MNINWFYPQMRMYMFGLAPLGFVVSEGEGVLGTRWEAGVGCPG
jgi:hypothetical protein